MCERDRVREAMARLLSAAEPSAAVRSEWTTLAGGSALHHLEAGAGSEVVLLHGGSGGGANWFRLFGQLSRRYRVLAPDLPGFGLSDPIEAVAPLGRTAAATLEEWLTKQSVGTALVVGTSFGGLVALRLAQQSARVSALLLLDSAGLGRGIHPSVRLITSLPLTAPFVRPSRHGTAALFRRLLTTDRSGISPEQQDALIDYLHASGRRAGTRYLAETLRLFAGAVGQREVLSADELESIALPVSVVWGERDRLLPVSDARLAVRLMADAELTVLPGTGHSPNWERPSAVVEAIDDLHARRAHALPDGRAG